MMKNIFQFKKTTNATDIVAERLEENSQNDDGLLKQPNQPNQHHHYLNTLNEPFFLTHTLNATCKRRFSENYYKSFDIHKRPRLVKKCGELNIHMENVPKHKRRLLSDFFNTILDIKWRWHIAIFLLSFLISWFLFATIWYMIAFFHGDLKTAVDNKIENSTILDDQANYMQLNNITDVSSTTADNKHMPCVYGVHDFTSALLYSVETQHTIGYGLRHITEECSFAIIFLMLQSCFGIFVQGLVAGVVFAKISRPNKRKRTIIFSHNAVVSQRDGKLCFMFKLANIRISQLSDARVKMLMIKSRRTDEGEFIPFQSFDMKVGHDWSGNDSVFFPWPKTVEHVIDENSPLYEICKQAQTKRNSYKSDDFNTLTTTESNHAEMFEKKSHNSLNKSIKNEDYEIVVILEGNIETTGASCHIRTSYLPQEILFGYRFTPIYPKFTDFEYLFDYSKFDQVEPFQYELLDLNVAFTNRHLNCVYDARAENKNFNLTYQNTLQKEEKSEKIKKESGRPAVSLATILSTFKFHQNQNDSSKFRTLLKSDKNRKSSFDENEILNLTNPQLNDKVKNGRFTVCPVEIKPANHNKIKLNQKHCTSLLTMDINEKLCTMKSNEKRSHQLSKQVLFHMHQKKQAAAHYRTNSLPPFHSNSQSEFVSIGDEPVSNEDEGYLTSNKNNSKVDLNM